MGKRGIRFHCPTTDYSTVPSSTPIAASHACVHTHLDIRLYTLRHASITHTSTRRSVQDIPELPLQHPHRHLTHRPDRPPSRPHGLGLGRGHQGPTTRHPSSAAGAHPTGSLPAQPQQSHSVPLWRDRSARPSTPPALGRPGMTLGCRCLPSPPTARKIRACTASGTAHWRWKTCATAPRASGVATPTRADRRKESAA